MARCVARTTCVQLQGLRHRIQAVQVQILWHRYKGSMDARSFQHHAARVAELTDALLAERAADKAARELAPEADPSQDAAPETVASTSAASSGSPVPSPHRSTLSSSPGIAHAAPAATAMSDLSLGHQARFSPESAGVGGSSGQSMSSTKEENQSYLPGLVRDNPLSASSCASTSAGGNSPSFLPSAEGMAGSLGGSRGPYYCTVCKVSTTSAVHLQTHYMGSKHQRRLAQTQSHQDSNSSQHYCPICAISATSAVHLQLHLNGRAHQRKAKLASEGIAVQGGGFEHAPAALAPSSEAGEASSAHGCLVQQRMGCSTRSSR